MKRVWIIGLPLLAVVIALGFLFTQLQPELPQPTGPHKVGYERFAVTKGDQWVDVQAFYPTKQITDHQPQAIPADLAVEFGKATTLPPLQCRTNAPYPPISAQK